MISANFRVQASDGYFFEQFAISSTPAASSAAVSVTPDDESRLTDFKIDQDPKALEVMSAVYVTIEIVE